MKRKLIIPTNNYVLSVFVLICILSSVFNDTIAQLYHETDSRDSLKKEMFNYLNNIGDLEELNTFSEAEGRTYTYELIDKTRIFSKTFGIYGFGVNSSDTKTYLIIIDDLKYFIIDTEDLLNALYECIRKLKDMKVSDERALKYIEEILIIYKRNKIIGDAILNK